MAVIMRDALKPNLMQTLENTPVLVHAGPFGNIAHGNSSVVADLIGIHGGEFLVTEAGFGADMGAERFFNIKCRASGLTPDAAVVVATVRALKAHSGQHKIVAGRPLPEALLAENPDEVHVGGANLRKQIENIRLHGVSPVVAINAFPGDHPSEHAAIAEIAAEMGARVAVCTHFADGGRGARELAEVVAEAADEPSDFRFLYPDSASLKEKIETIATKVYGADGVDYDLTAVPPARDLRAQRLRRPAGLHRQDPPVAVVRRVAQGGAHGLAAAGAGGAGLGRRRVHLPDLRRHAHDAGPRRHPRRAPDRHRRGRQHRQPLLRSRRACVRGRAGHQSGRDPGGDPLGAFGVGISPASLVRAGRFLCAGALPLRRTPRRAVAPAVQGATETEAVRRPGKVCDGVGPTHRALGRSLQGSHQGHRAHTQVVTWVSARLPWCGRVGSCVRRTALNFRRAGPGSRPGPSRRERGDRRRTRSRRPGARPPAYRGGARCRPRRSCG